MTQLKSNIESKHLYLKSLFQIDQRLQSQKDTIENWFEKQWQQTQAPIYTSVDIRYCGFKLAPVDTNLFPAGFNNLHPRHIPQAAAILKATLAKRFPQLDKLLLIPENHTRNLHYLQSLATLQQIASHAGIQTRIGSLNTEVTTAQTITLSSGQQLTLEPLIRNDHRLGGNGFFPPVALLNNDLSRTVPEIFDDLQQTVLPRVDLGWGARLKSHHFEAYAQVAKSLAIELNIDPWLLQPLFDQCPEVNFLKKEGEACLVQRADALLNRIRKKYLQYNIKQEPFLIVKADAGTYGMGVIMIKTAEELSQLNRKQRTRMSTTKGNKPITKALIQEGIYSFDTINNAVAEPVIYLIDGQMVSGFYRSHPTAKANENLNQSEALFLAFPPQEITTQHTKWYAYEVIAHLATLAAAHEQPQEN